MIYAQASSPAVALTDTTEVSLGSITVSQKMAKITGIWIQVLGGGPC